MSFFVVSMMAESGADWVVEGVKVAGNGQPTCLKTFTAPQWQQLSNIATMMLLLRSSRR
jgi:hypothetical protein